MSSGNNFHLSAMSPSPVSLSTWSCDPAAQPLGLNELHKNTKTKKKTLAGIWVPRQFGKSVRKPQWSGCLDSCYPQKPFPTNSKVKSSCSIAQFSKMCYLCVSVCACMCVCARMHAQVCKVNPGVCACYVLTFH